MTPSPWAARTGRAVAIGLFLTLGPWIHVALALGLLYGLTRTAWRAARRFRPVPPSLLVVIIVAGILNTGPDLLQAGVSLALCLAYAGLMPQDPACHEPA